MWADGLDARTHAENIENGLFPFSVFATYSKDERESVTWPRRGYISLNTVATVATAQYAAKIRSLIENEYAQTNGNTIYLTAEGKKWIPAIINYLMPPEQLNQFHEITQNRLTLRSVSVQLAR